MHAKSVRSLSYRDLSSILECFLLILLFAGQSSGQIDDLFNTVLVERRLKSRYHLTSKDLHLLRPLIDRQNEDLLIALSNRLETENTNFLSLWEDMRGKRAKFEVSMPKSLSSRQRLALRAARAEAESKISAEWLDSYLVLLEDLLELDWVQGNFILKVLEIERGKRLQFLGDTVSDPTKKDNLWHSATAEREEAMLLILSPAQLITYRKMIDPSRRLVA